MPKCSRSSSLRRLSRLAAATGGWIAFTWLAAVGGSLAACSSTDHADVLVLVNSASPISKAIGEYYRAQRGIPEENVLALEIPLEHPDLSTDDHETVSREDFDRRVREPVERFLKQRKLVDDIRIIVTTKGVPLRIDGPKVQFEDHLLKSTRASVDAELALLFSDAGGSAGVRTGANPYFNSALDFRRFREESPKSPLRYLVARLTGYQEPLDPETGVPTDIKAMIDAAQATPAASAVWLIDEDPSLPAATDSGNRLLLAAAAAILEGMGHSVVHDKAETFASDVDDIQGYASWGSNDQNGPGPPVYGEIEGRRYPGRFVPRSIVVDLVSTNARSFTWPPEYGQSTTADLIRAGASGGAGHVYEPSLSGVAHPAVLFRRYAQGVPVIEAFYRSLPFLGWMNVYVGDPLMVIAEDCEEAEQADLDGDGIADELDNCRALANAGQEDSDGDGFGNICDADVNNSGVVTTSWGAVFPTGDRGDVEWIARTVQIGGYRAEHDLDSDGDVDEGDVAIAHLLLFRPPGPRGE